MISTQLGSVLRRYEEPVLVKADKSYRQLTVRLHGKGVVLRGEVNGSQIASERAFAVREGQFILSRIDARNGAFGLVPASLDGAVVSRDFPSFDVDESRVLPSFLEWMSKTREFVSICQLASEGTTNRVRLQEAKFLEAEIPLPPLAEQQRIVARIEALAGKIAAARRLREEAAMEREALSATALRVVRESLMNDGYSVVHIGEITTVTSGGTPSRNIDEYWLGGTIPWVKTGELVDSDIFETEEYISVEGLKHSSAKLFPADTILVALYGQGQTRGRTGRLMIDATTNQACCAILPSPQIFTPRYIQYWLRSMYLEMREESQGGAQPNWNGAMIKNIRVALPPLSIQEKTINYMDRIVKMTAELEASQTRTQRELDALLPAILDRAFKGEL